MSTDAKKFIKEVSTIIEELRSDLELVVESETDLPPQVIGEFQGHIDQAKKIEEQLTDIIFLEALKK
ncbi:hypothetical protein LPJGGPFB_06575 [Ensifer adhaerens]|uniref:hypothetical protein n=1 Tax=Ensifer adhaerens TaxID=106592 RepID=UPI001568B688|nr:hypothetical protein [Ensifer adhaerens]NRP23305.1 hypothetical protein [Ensifer adhaerens]